VASSYTTSRGQTEFLDGGTYGESALTSYDIGWRPIPQVKGTKVPPRGLRYKRYREEPLPRDQVVSWVKAYPNCDIGFLTGRGPDHFVIDVDERNDGLRTLHSMPELGDDMYHTLLGYSPNGLHAHFRLGGRELPSTQHTIGPGIDTKGEGGYVKVPPSAGYGFYRGGLVPLEEVQVLPEWVVEVLAPEPPPPKTPVSKEPRVPDQKLRERELKTPVSPATRDDHEGDTVGEHEFVTMLSPWWSLLAS
jgi:Bifunctional DNA primase/polymerase, N-terminal